MKDLINLIMQFSGLGQDMLQIGFYVFLRVAAAMAVIPAFGDQAVPQRVKLVIALAFTAVVAPAVASQFTKVETPSATLFLTETIAGLIIGLAIP